VVLSQFITQEPDNAINLLLLEIIYHLFRLESPQNLLGVGRTGSEKAAILHSSLAKKDTALSGGIHAKENTTPMDRKRVQHIYNRHSRFGGSFQVTRMVRWIWGRFDVDSSVVLL